MNGPLVQRFIQLIATNTGLHIREQDQKALWQRLETRIKSLKLSIPEEYYQLLEAGTDRGDREWKELILLLTTGESYFFRDQGQLTLLQTKILPQLVKHRKKVQYAKGEAKPSLRIWSAGCSTGEEVYSLAILLRELIPDWNEWNVLILGTDINRVAIEQAKQGVYGSWSFRKVDPNLQMRYFSQQSRGWEIDEGVRRMVTFCAGNLIKDAFPSYISDIHNMDIILCRNVFIYFDSKSIAAVLEKFYHTLRPEGYLITGHAELHGQPLGRLQAKVFPESVVYQRSEAWQVASRSTEQSPTPAVLSKITVPQGDATNKVVPPAAKGVLIANKVIRSIPPSKPPLLKENSQTASQVLSQAETRFNDGAYAIAIKAAEQVIREHPRHLDAYCLIAQAYANLGQYQEASHYCQRALEVDSLSETPYYLLAHIAEEQGDAGKAKDLFKKIIYLVPSSIPAYLELGSLYEREGDATRARKMRSTAFELLEKLPPQATLKQRGEVTASELLLHVKSVLRNSSTQS